MRHVVFRVASERFALPLSAVREVVLPQPPFARVPRVSEAVRGVMNLRGRVVAVVDLAALMGLSPQPLAAGDGPRPHPRPGEAHPRPSHRRRPRGGAARGARGRARGPGARSGDGVRRGGDGPRGGGPGRRGGAAVRRAVRRASPGSAPCPAGETGVTSGRSRTPREMATDGEASPDRRRRDLHAEHDQGHLLRVRVPGRRGGGERPRGGREVQGAEARPHHDGHRDAVQERHRGDARDHQGRRARP